MNWNSRKKVIVINAILIAGLFGFIVYSASIAVFIVLMMEELKPMWGASTCYDIFDIIASGVGSSLAIIVYELLRLISGTKES